MTEASLTRAVATFAAHLSYDDLPAEVVRLAKRLTLDTLGCALAAPTLGEGCRQAIDLMARLGGPPRSTILGTGIKVGAANAAFANGALANALNYAAAGTDVGHTGVACLAAPLALAQARGPVDGRRFLTAVVISAELTTRMTLASAAARHLGGERLLLSGQYFGYIPAAAAAGAVLALDAATMHSALGLALMHVSGSRQVIVGGDPPAKAIFGAFPNQAAVVSALLAEAGLDARIDAIDGPAGFYALVGGAFDREALLGGLGRRFRCLEITFKPWPVSGVVTPFIQAALELASAHDLRPSDVVAVELIGSPHLRQWCEPLDERRRPRNAASAANSTIYPTAKALAHRAVTLADFTAEGLRDPVALALADRTTFLADARSRGGAVAATTTDGRRLTASVEQRLGDPERPLSDAQVHAKFRDCCSFAPNLSVSDVDALIAFVESLEDVDDVSPLAR